ncbi:MAG TPA: hypothetical protein VFD92_12405 [Candidatus Binatia bacterium]|nr:hypothetical protein [Candidatus Binatia bacterium]
MQTSVFRPASLRMVAIAFALMLAHSVVPLAHGKTHVDCTTNDNNFCKECCDRPGATSEQIAACVQGKYDCCFFGGAPVNGCNIILGQTAPIATLKLNESIGGLKLMLQRKELNGGVVSVKLKEGIVGTTSLPKGRLSAAAILTGADASVGSLLYPVAFLLFGEAAIDQLQSRGYDVFLVDGGVPKTCQAVLTNEFCTAFAKQLAQSIDELIQVGDPADRDAFLQGIQTLGFSPCDCDTCNAMSCG